MKENYAGVQSSKGLQADSELEVCCSQMTFIWFDIYYGVQDCTSENDEVIGECE